MPRLLVVRYLCVTALLLVSCTSSETRIHLAVHGDSSWQIDRYELAIGEHMKSAGVYQDFDLVVPDAMAGHEQTLEVTAYAADAEIAFGSLKVTPVLHAQTNADLTLAATSCMQTCKIGTTVCASDGTETCIRLGDGCAGWSAITPCPSAMPFCSNGTCAATCSDECHTGATTCDGTSAVRTCGQFDTDSCLDWSMPSPCSAGATCDNGSCGTSCDPAACTMPPAPTCISGTTLRVPRLPASCSAGGACDYAYTDVACPDACIGHACRSIGAGGEHSCAVMPDRTIECWGANDNGQASAPTGTFLAVTTGLFHSCGLHDDGTVECWGLDTEGDTLPPSGAFKAITAGFKHTCGIRSTGTIACWGANDDGQSSPPAGPFKSVSAGFWHTCGVKTNGSVACWGYAESGQTIVPTTGTYTVATAGRTHSCALDSNQGIHCWGSDDYGQQQVPSGPFVRLTSGGFHNCAIQLNGTTRCWGDLTTSTTSALSLVSAGDRHACGIATNGTLACWGDDSHGQATPP